MCRIPKNAKVADGGVSFPRETLVEVGSGLSPVEEQNYIVVVDYCSRFILCDILPDIQTSSAVKKLEWFCLLGIPHSLRSDNGPQFVSDGFQSFLRRWKVQHVTSSPKYPQSNGEVEKAVQRVKSLLRKNVNLQAALCSYRDSPLRYGYSPSKLLFQRFLHFMGISNNTTMDLPRLRQAERDYRKQM